MWLVTLDFLVKMWPHIQNKIESVDDRFSEIEFVGRSGDIEVVVWR